MQRALMASHILPWSKFPDQRVNPKNGLCLSRLHDAAFDQGLIAFDEKSNLILSERIKRQFDNSFIREAFAPFEGKPIRASNKFSPEPAFLEQHRREFFVDKHCVAAIPSR